MNKKKVSALALSTMMIMSMGTSVFAANVGTKENPATASVTKDLQFAEGITTPDATFEFSAIKVQPETAGAPDATIASIKYLNTDNVGTLSAGKYSVKKDSKIEFGTFPHAGEYKYTVTETKGSVEGMSYSTQEYTLKVLVANDDANGLYVKSITAVDNKTNEKPDEIKFTNTYVKNGGKDDGKDALVIEKNTKGDLADKTKDFDFELKFIKAATTAEADKTVTGKIGNDDVTFEYDKVTKFQLHGGEQLVFKDIPAGTRYVVTEVGADDGYTAGVDVIENGTATTKKTAVNDADSVCSAENNQSNLIGEKENKVTFTNTYKDVPITGIIANNMPFVLMAAFALLASVGYALTKRRFTKR